MRVRCVYLCYACVVQLLYRIILQKYFLPDMSAKGNFLSCLVLSSIIIDRLFLPFQLSVSRLS